MKRTLFVLMMSVAGGAIGIITSLMFTAFIPACGEDCSSGKLTNLILFFVGGLVVFSTTSYFFSRRSIPSLKNSLLGSTVVGSLFLVPAFTYYVYELRSEYLMFKAISPVQPTTDFFHMAISTSAVQGVTDARYGTVKPLAKIPQWERCLIGATQCESSPRQVEVLCKVGVVHVNESDWPAFTLIPHENSPGVAPLKSMQLCND